MFTDFFRGSEIDGAGVRFLFGNASLRQIVDDRFGFDLKVTGQFVDSDLVRVRHLPRNLFLI
jgi:hypothetical protein